MAKLRFLITSPEQLRHIRKAQEELRRAGVSFDTGSDLDDEGKPTTRVWELDWSLKGAELMESSAPPQPPRRSATSVVGVTGFTLPPEPTQNLPKVQ